MEEYEMERIPQMKEYLGKLRNDMISRRLKVIESKVRSNEKNIRESFLEAIRKLVSDKTGGTVTVSYLRSSYITGSHEVYLAYYEEEPFVMEEPESICFSFKSLFVGTGDDLQEAYEKLEEKFIRISKGEKEEIRRWYMEGIYVRLGKVIGTVLPVVQDGSGIEVCCGGYMEELEMAGRI